MILKPIDNTIKNKYDSIFKIATHAFVNALIPLIELPDDDYKIRSCEIFSPGGDVKSMDILLEGGNGDVNIEFHKQPLIKRDLDRDFGYVSNYYLKDGKTIDQKIVVVDMDRESIEKIQITPHNSYKGNYYYVPNIDGCEVLSSIKHKIKNNQKITEYEKYVFSILPLTNHSYQNEEKLVEELCYLTQKLNISERDKDSISLCHLILLELFVNDQFLYKKLLGVITMTSSFIENYENELKKETEKVKTEYENFKNEAEARIEDAEARVEDAEARVEDAEARVDDAEARVEDAEARVEDAEARVEDARDETRTIKENSEQFFSEINSNAEKLGLSDSQKKVLFSTTIKF